MSGADAVPRAAPAGRGGRWSPWGTAGLALVWFVSVLAIGVEPPAAIAVCAATAVLASAMAKRPRPAEAGPPAPGADAPSLVGQPHDAPRATSAAPGYDQSPPVRPRPSAEVAAVTAPPAGGLRAVTDDPSGQVADVPPDLMVLAPEQVAAALRLPEPTIMQALQDGRLPGNHLDGHWRVRRAALVAWIDGSAADRG